MVIVYWPLSYLLTLIKLYVATFVLGRVQKKSKTNLFIIATGVGIVSMFVMGIVYTYTGQGHKALIHASSLLAIITIMFLLTGLLDVVKLGIVVAGISLFESQMLLSTYSFFNVQYTEHRPVFYIMLASEGLVAGLVVVIALLSRAEQLVKKQRIPTESHFLLLTAAGLLAISIYLVPVLLMSYLLPVSKQIQIKLGFLVSITIFVCVHLLYYKNLIKKQKLQADADRYKQQSSSLRNYYEKRLIEEDKIRKINHETNAHFNQIKNKISIGDIEGALTYMSNISHEKAAVKASITGNMIVDVILNDEIAKHPTVCFDWQGHIPSKLNIRDDELCTIFANAIGNAMTAASECENGFVKGHVKYHGKHIGCYIQNSVAAPVKFKGDLPDSSRRGKEHGHGIPNMLRAMSDSNGDVTFSYKDGVFYTDLNFRNIIL